MTEPAVIPRLLAILASLDPDIVRPAGTGMRIRNAYPSKTKVSIPPPVSPGS